LCEDVLINTGYIENHVKIIVNRTENIMWRNSNFLGNDVIYFLVLRKCANFSWDSLDTYHGFFFCFTRAGHNSWGSQCFVTNISEKKKKKRRENAACECQWYWFMWFVIRKNDVRALDFPFTFFEDQCLSISIACSPTVYCVNVYYWRVRSCNWFARGYCFHSVKTLVNRNWIDSCFDSVSIHYNV